MHPARAQEEGDRSTAWEVISDEGKQGDRRMHEPAYVDELPQYLNITAFKVWDQSDKARLGRDTTVHRWTKIGFMLCFPSKPAEQKLHVVRDKGGRGLALS